jgi:hypothetical protein
MIRISEDEQPAEGGPWSPSPPPAPSGFRERTTFSLTKPEAKYLAERIWEFGQTVFGALHHQVVRITSTLGPASGEQITVGPNFQDAIRISRRTGVAEHARKGSFLSACVIFTKRRELYAIE